LTAQGIGNATYFSPHLMQQDYFVEHGACHGLPVTDDVGGRIISLPLFDTMTRRDLSEVVHAMQRELMVRLGPTMPRRVSRRTASVSSSAVLAKGVLQEAAQGIVP